MIEELSMNFALKCVESNKEKLKNMFPLRTKQHNMNARKKEHYLVNHANTERYKNSSIPYMQRLLNKNEALKEKELNSTK